MGGGGGGRQTWRNVAVKLRIFITIRFGPPLICRAFVFHYLYVYRLQANPNHSFHLFFLLRLKNLLFMWLRLWHKHNHEINFTKFIGYTRFLLLKSSLYNRQINPLCLCAWKQRKYLNGCISNMLMTFIGNSLCSIATMQMFVFFVCFDWKFTVLLISLFNPLRHLNIKVWKRK